MWTTTQVSSIPCLLVFLKWEELIVKVCKTIFISIILSALNALAGPSVIGNGGNGVYLENNFYILDLVEADSHIQPFMKDVTASGYFYDRLKYALHTFEDPSLVALVAKKITELGALDLLYTEALLRTFEEIRWNLVDYRLALIPVDTPVAAALHQVAIRTSDNILIDRHYWNLLSPIHRVALLFHEANFILIRPSSSAHADDLQKSVFQSRLLTGYIFSNSMATEYSASFSRRLFPLFPSQLGTINGEKAFYIYRTKAFSAFAFEDVITTNPYLEIIFDQAKLKLNLFRASQQDVVMAICEQKELPKLVQVNTHIMHLELYKGDNNSQDYLSFHPALDEGFPPLKPQIKTCVDQVTKFYNDLERHIN